MTILLLRLSSLGNVAMTVPVIASLSMRYREHTFVVVAKKQLSAMFAGMDNVVYHEFKPQTRGLLGLVDTFHELEKEYHIDMVVDLQDILPTRLLRALFRLHHKPVYSIHYGRKEKRLLTWHGAHRSEALPSEFDRYRETLRRAGLETDTDFEALPINNGARERVREQFGVCNEHWIGIAPFAKSRSNMLSYRTTKEVIQHLANLPDTHVFLFGAGEIETEMLRQWASIFDNVTSVAGLLPLEEELELMRQLQYMLCMDSANQHLSSLVGLRAISIWCGTHPMMGFSGWKQNADDILQLNHLNCRPCTAHGTNYCRFRNFACREITAQQIIKKVQP